MSLVKQIHAHRAFKFGRLRPDPKARRLAFADYAKPPLPAPPDAIRYQRRGDHLERIFANNRLGDCTAAGAGHTLALWRGAAANGDRMPTVEDVIAFYSKTAGYVPGDPSTDQGGDEVTVLNAWRNDGFFSDGTGKIAAWVTIDATNWLEVRQAMWLAESLYFGVELPDEWVSEVGGNGYVWDVAGAPNPENGHCFVGIGYDESGVVVDSWGLFGTITPAAIAKYAAGGGGELYCMFSEDSVSKASKKAASGFDFKTLLADSAAL